MSSFWYPQKPNEFSSYLGLLNTHHDPPVAAITSSLICSARSSHATLPSLGNPQIPVSPWTLIKASREFGLRNQLITGAPAAIPQGPTLWAQTKY